MRKITKGKEPEELCKWKRKNPGRNYQDLTHVERQAINRETLKEQFGLCAYCCKKINASNSMNEHVEARDLAPDRQLYFGNIVASCNTKGRCDDAHKSQVLPLTPLMAECETELKFYLSGKVKGVTERASKSIKVLNLDNQALREERKQMVETLLFPDTGDKLHLLGDELLKEVVADFIKPDDQGFLLPYSPVLVNIIRHILASGSNQI